ncbi:hypothetical protein FHT00_000900 [Sphingomonas insulae]|nr:hypothetical protein [Sphingomonas insulae]NIJ28967.1 hypothetical protein [Sphingomonas insulae]
MTINSDERPPSSGKLSEVVVWLSIGGVLGALWREIFGAIFSAFS